MHSREISVKLDVKMTPELEHVLATLADAVAALENAKIELTMQMQSPVLAKS